MSDAVQLTGAVHRFEHLTELSAAGVYRDDPCMHAVTKGLPFCVSRNGDWHGCRYMFAVAISTSVVDDHCSQLVLAVRFHKYQGQTLGAINFSVWGCLLGGTILLNNMA